MRQQSSTPEPHWDIDWTEQGVARNYLPLWVAFVWVIFLLWGVVYLVDSASAW